MAMNIFTRDRPGRVSTFAGSRKRVRGSSVFMRLHLPAKYVVSERAVRENHRHHAGHADEQKDVAASWRSRIPKRNPERNDVGVHDRDEARESKQEREYHINERGGVASSAERTM